MLHEIGREPTPEELAEKLSMPIDKVRKVLKNCKEPISWLLLRDEEDSHRRAISSRIRTLFSLLMRRSILTCVKQQHGFWPSSLLVKNVYCGSFGIGMNTDHTLEEVDRQFSVTRERIRQIEAKALRKLKQILRSRNLISWKVNLPSGDRACSSIG